MEGGNLDIPPSLVQLGFNAYEFTGLSLLLEKEGGKKGKKSTQHTITVRDFNKKRQQRRKWEEAKVKPERRSFSSAVCKSAIEVGLHQESPGGFGGACWHFWHWSSTDLNRDKTSGWLPLWVRQANFIQVQSDWISPSLTGDDCT